MKKLFTIDYNGLPILALFILITVTHFSASAKSLKADRLRPDTVKITDMVVVVDENESALPGVNLTNKRTRRSVVTDSTGLAKLAAQSGDLITVYIKNTLVGQYSITNTFKPVIRLSTKNSLVKQLKKVVLTNNILVSPDKTAASTDAVYNNDLIKMPVTSVKNAVTGRLTGVHTLQSSGRPSADEVALTLRGQTPLVIVDGIPRNLSVLDLEEVESVTVLKDALAAVALGLRSSNGALVITTKKGTPGAPRISLTAQEGVQTSLKMPQPLDAFNYATLYNEALINDGRAPVYTAADLQAYKTGSDPYGHPNVNWQNLIFNKSSIFSRYDANINGGDKNARYYVGFEYQNQQGDLKQNAANTYNTNNNFNNFTIRSNVDLSLTKRTSLDINLFGRIINSSAPGSGTDNLYSNVLNTPALAYPVFNADGSYGGNANFQNNIYAQSTGSGYNLNYRRDIMTDISLRRSFDNVIPGLWAQALVSSYSSLSENTDRSKAFAIFYPIVSNGITSYQQFGRNGAQNNSTSISYQNRQLYYEGAIGYKRKFGLHEVDAQVRATSDNFFNNSDLSLNYYGGSGRFQYNYDERYTIEVAAGLDRTNRYPSGTPMGLFPAAGLTWNITKEHFMPHIDWLNDFKLFGSYGKTGNDAAGYFIYNQYFTGSGGYYFGTGPTSYGGLRMDVLAYPGITWEKANKLNLGLNTTLLNNHLFVQAEYFNNNYYDLLTSPRVSSLVGISVNNQNIGSNRYNGVELQADWQQSFKDFSYYINANISTLASKVLYMNEYQANSYMFRTGQPVGQEFGYVAQGLYQNQAEINNSPKMAGYNPVPGDIKYKDLNGDGVINYLDQAPIGTTKPLVDYGLVLGFNFRGIDFSMLVQGVANRNELLTGNSVWEFQNNGFGQAYVNNLNRWTPATAATATYPRLSVGTNVNNDVASSFWMHSGDYWRIKNLEIGYNLPKTLTQKLRINGLRIFLSGTNLFTHAAYGAVDPEANTGGYPIQRVINGGINIKL